MLEWLAIAVIFALLALWWRRMNVIEAGMDARCPPAGYDSRTKPAKIVHEPRS